MFFSTKAEGYRDRKSRKIQENQPLPAVTLVFSFFEGYRDRKSSRFPKVVDFLRKSRFFRRFSFPKFELRKSRESINIFRYTVDINVISFDHYNILLHQSLQYITASIYVKNTAIYY